MIKQNHDDGRTWHNLRALVSGDATLAEPILVGAAFLELRRLHRTRGEWNAFLADQFGIRIEKQGKETLRTGGTFYSYRTIARFMSQARNVELAKMAKAEEKPVRDAYERANKTQKEQFHSCKKVLQRLGRITRDAMPYLSAVEREGIRAKWREIADVFDQRACVRVAAIATLNPTAGC